MTKSRWVLITGTSTGIGRATALRLAAEGFSVIAAVRRQADAGELSAAAKGQWLRALITPKAPAKVLVGRDAVLGAMLKKWLPASWFEAILRREFGFA